MQYLSGRKPARTVKAYCTRLAQASRVLSYQPFTTTTHRDANVPVGQAPGFFQTEESTKIRIDGAQLRVKRIRQSRIGAFCVADLSTDIGEFKVKDPLLDQFDEGEYQATVWISEIYLSQYVAFGKGVTEIRARLHDLQVQAQGALRRGDEQVEPDPIDEREPLRAAPAAPAAAEPKRKKSEAWERFNKKKPSDAPGEKSSDAGDSRQAEHEPAIAHGLSALFDADLVQAIQDRAPVKLDSTVERSLLRRQAAELGQALGYSFDPKQQTWFAQ